MQAGGVDAVVGNRRQTERTGDVVQLVGERVERAAEPIVVEQRCGRAQPGCGGVRLSPALDVVQRARRRQAVGDQGRDHLPMREVGPAPHGTGAIDDADHLETLEHRHQQRQGARQEATGERIQARESSRQIIERTGRFEPIAAAEFCHNTMAHFTGSVAEALDQVNVLIRAISLADLLETHEHFPNIIRPEAALHK